MAVSVTYILTEHALRHRSVSIKSSIDGNALPCNISGLSGSEEGDKGGYFFRLPETVERDRLLKLCLVQTFNHISPYESPEPQH